MTPRAKNLIGETSLSPQSPRNGKDFISKNINNIKVYQDRIASVSPKDRRSKSPWKRYNFDGTTSNKKSKSPLTERQPAAQTDTHC